MPTPVKTTPVTATPVKTLPEPRRIAVAATVGMIALVTATGCGADTQSAVTPAAPTSSAPPSSASSASAASSASSASAASVAGLAGTQLLAVAKPAPLSEAAGMNCPWAVRQHDNKHNICASWVNDAPVFTGPGRLSNTTANFTVSKFEGPVGEE